ncbi:Ail/Lom family outer membrane beta-barrel protein [Entomohabitans teleogrylli]|uniref:Ail/Lom family outer membrane beta-barrel protein n=1 Tax=Entomohabitans teleogrylli TaxID=1384589 RepID=UPI00073D3015|nr:Ail/Lom family outer membrane beta-barrel protein [Entomohabitans teleogrylli]
MTKLHLSGAALFTLLLAAPAIAGHSTVSLGYAQADAGDINDPRGFNLKYRYEWDFPVGIIGSFSYLSASDDSFSPLSSYQAKNNLDSKYYSFGAGPAWRINDYISLYGLLGIGYTRAEYSTSVRAASSQSQYVYLRGETSSRSAWMYGLGLQVNVYEGMSFDVGYEAAKYDASSSHSDTLNSFNLNVGYRF